MLGFPTVTLFLKKDRFRGPWSISQKLVPRPFVQNNVKMGGGSLKIIPHFRSFDGILTDLGGFWWNSLESEKFWWNSMDFMKTHWISQDFSEIHPDSA